MRIIGQVKTNLLLRTYDLLTKTTVVMNREQQETY